MAIVPSIVLLARWLDNLSVAEGVETVEHNELLRQLGCNQAQGYLHASAYTSSEEVFASECLVVRTATTAAGRQFQFG